MTQVAPTPTVVTRVEVTDRAGRHRIEDMTLDSARIVYAPQDYVVREVRGYDTAEGFCIVRRQR